MSDRHALVFGHPEFSSTIQAQFPRLFEVLPRVQAALNDLTGRACDNPQPHQRVILNLGILAGISMSELVTLAGNGLGQGAMKITRTLMETVVNAEYLRRYPPELECYLGWAWIEKKRNLDYLRTNLAHLLGETPQADIDKIESEFAAARHLFLKPNGDLRSSWSRSNFAERSAQIGLASLYRLVNPLSSAFIHATIGGLEKHFNIEEDVHRIAVPPSLGCCAGALAAGHQLVCVMIETLSRTFDWTPIHSIASLSDDFQYAWPAPTSNEAPSQQSES